MRYERKTSDIFIGEEFRKILNIFKDQSTIAKLLLSRRINKDLLQTDHVNFIDISKTEMDKISYLTQDRIAQISQSDTHDFWTTSRRYKVKPGAFINKMFKNIPGKEVEKFATLWKTFSVEKNFNFKIVSGEDIRKYYLSDKHYSDSGTLDSSCMKHPKCQKYLNIYVENPNVKMLIMTFGDTDQMLGRALLWETMDGKKVMDRIYTVNDEEYLNHFIKWADDNGYYSKKFQNFRSAVQWKKGSQYYDFELSIKIQNYDFEYYPYLDTFKFLDIQEGILSNVCKDIENRSRYRCLISAGGGWENPNFVIMDYIDREYYYYGDMSQVVNNSGETVWAYRGNCSYSNLYETYIMESEALYSESIQDYIYKLDSRNDHVKINDQIEYINAQKVTRTRVKKSIYDLESSFHISPAVSGSMFPTGIETILVDYNTSPFNLTPPEFQTTQATPTAND
jgi:hypothetical protein